MKIALLNLPFDNNYGGNLQRYALIKTLQEIGHEVRHVNLRFADKPNMLKLSLRVPIRLLKRIVGRKTSVLSEWHNYKRWHNMFISAEPFYNKYIPHTNEIVCLSDFKGYDKFDAVLVGSDQVWRKKIAQHHLYNLFMDFISSDTHLKRIAYGVSLGSEENELDDDDICKLGKLYQRFSSVSVRERSALDLFKSYGWITPQAELVLDPTLLLCDKDYDRILSKDTVSGGLFCYILDPTDAKRKFAEKESVRQNLQMYNGSINNDAKSSIEEWLGIIRNSEFIITDSFHGMVFSIIFHKPFIVIGNEFRGLGRFKGLLSMLGLEDRLMKEDDIILPQIMRPINWEKVDEKLSFMRAESKKFIEKSLRNG